MFLVHLFLPHNSNNHRPKILHNDSLLIISLFFLLLTIILPIVKINNPRILGIATNITVNSLLELTNKERGKNNLSPLVLNSQLSKAAAQKAKHMFTNNYWSHNSPDGITPWVFIADSNYEYSYAGENLARDFTNPEDAVSAWMTSQGHRANILSSNYQDIGFAVVTGKLNGRDTTLIVQLFGSKKGTSIASRGEKNLPVVEVLSAPIINQKSLVNNVVLTILGLLVLVLAIDAILVNRKNIIRFVGHNIDHIIFLASFILILIIFKGGAVL